MSETASNVIDIKDFKLSRNSENALESVTKLEPERSWFVDLSKLEELKDVLDLENRQSYKIIQGYIRKDERLPETLMFLQGWRLRKQLDRITGEVKFFRTKKEQIGEDVLNKQETEFDNLTNKVFAKYWDFIRNRKLEKIRYVIPCDRYGNVLVVADEDKADYFMDLDIVTSIRGGKLRPSKYLVRVEVEGKSITDIKSFNSPSWFGPETTGDRRFNNGNLVKKSSLDLFENGWEQYF
jgi:hypothetical protein